MGLVFSYRIVACWFLSCLGAPFYSFGQQTVDRAPCAISGAAFGVDLLGNGLLVKDPTGYIRSLKTTSSTKVLRISTTGTSGGDKVSPIRFADIQSGDLVCALTGANESVSQVSIVSRGDVEQAQREFVAAWQKDSLFGKVQSLDSAAQRMVVTPADSAAPATVNLSGTTQFRTIPLNATKLSDGKKITAGDVKIGDTVYVHGQRTGGKPDLDAKVIITGGFRGIIGSFLDAQPLQGLARIHEFGSGKQLTLKVREAALYRTTNQLNSSYQVLGPDGPRLAPINSSDLQPGDIVLVVGQVDQNSSTGTGVALITRFGTFATLPGGDDQISWFLK